MKQPCIELLRDVPICDVMMRRREHVDGCSRLLNSRCTFERLRVTSETVCFVLVVKKWAPVQLQPPVGRLLILKGHSVNFTRADKLTGPDKYCSLCDNS